MPAARRYAPRSVEKPGCCEHANGHHRTLPAAVASTCCTAHAACNCVCCRVDNRPTAPINRYHTSSQPDLTLAAIAPFTIPIAADAIAGIASDQTAALAAAVPHRILHCSWII